MELSPLFDRIDDYAAYYLMGFAEFQSLADQVIGQFGGVGVVGYGGRRARSRSSSMLRRTVDATRRLPVSVSIVSKSASLSSCKSLL